MINTIFSYALTHVTPPRGRALWLYGEPHVAYGDVYHPWKDQAEALERKGCNVISDIDQLGNEYDAVFVNCPKQWEQTQGLIALALERAHGFVMAAARSDAGGNRLITLMQSYGLSVEQLSKYRSKAVWTMQAKQADRNKIVHDFTYLLPRQIMIEGEKWWSLPGVFGWNKIDTGSRLLLEHLPADLKGKVADFGCGYGYLSTTVEQRYSGVERIDAYDADAQAVQCCARNGGDKIHTFWQDIRTINPTPHYDAVIMNPPFHAGKNEDIALGQLFIQKAWQSLKPHGCLYMVANRNLPYEKVVPGLTIVFEGEGYKIMTVCKS